MQAPPSTLPSGPTAPTPVGAPVAAAAEWVDPAACPVCGQPNRCAMEQARLTGVAQDGPCWCTRVAFADSLLAQVPAQAQGKACICEACARRAAASNTGSAAA